MKAVSSFFLLTLLIQSSSSLGFVLVDPAYRLATPHATLVNIGNGGCEGNGISNEDLIQIITVAISRYWNTVGESRLQLYVGQEVNATATQGNASPGEILVGCYPYGASGPSGIAYPDPSTGAAVVHLNSTTFVPGGYSEGAIVATLTHELGHAIGLSHSDDPSSVMTYRNHDWGPAPEALSRDDQDGVIYLYPNKSSTLGLIGGCEATALKLRGSSSRFSFLSALFELIFLILLSGFFSFIIRQVWSKHEL